MPCRGSIFFVFAYRLLSRFFAIYSSSPLTVLYVGIFLLFKNRTGTVPFSEQASTGGENITNVRGEKYRCIDNKLQTG